MAEATVTTILGPHAPVDAIDDLTAELSPTGPQPSYATFALIPIDLAKAGIPFYLVCHQYGEYGVKTPRKPQTTSSPRSKYPARGLVRQQTMFDVAIHPYWFPNFENQSSLAAYGQLYR
ncbi:hypothetical protein N7519_007282 [Penicillium mononematosum]|uniref:uncharacterized protein n=1 Tax=Penicillium mononematosum TaxID=268346 RepID=UPI00254922B9|nr:uncharacterized protein N7519_007282 [Penicillium mononematosum]KAJ6185981.1 hypothetical protein N7519_007282 [Penicillium mononematosum]